MLSALKCLYTNADSLTTKKHFLEDLVKDYHPDIIGITEAIPKNLNEGIKEVELSINGYEMFSNLKGRGVCLYISSRLKASPANIKDSTEGVWCEIRLRKQDKLLIGCIYRSPNSTDDDNKKISGMLKQATEIKATHTLIMGDFNHPEIDWQQCSCDKSSNHPASKFLETIRDSFLYQHVTQATHFRSCQKANVLDLILTNEEEMINELEYLAPLGKSHHVVLKFEMKCYVPDSHNKNASYCYDKGDYSTMRRMFQDVDWDTELDGHPVEEMWGIIRNKLTTATAKCIPKKNYTKQSQQKPLWMTAAAKEKIKAKQKAFTIYRTTLDKKDYDNYARARNQAKWATRKAVQEFEKRIAKEAKTNPKAFYKYAKSKTKSYTGVPDLKKNNGSIASTDLEKSEILNNFFCDVFTRENTDDMPTCDLKVFSSTLSDVKFTQEDVEKKLDKLKIDKSAGPDGLHPRILRELSPVLSKPLYLLFRKSLHECKIPSSWKDAHVSPIFKKGSKSLPCNYRPISLTSVVCKLLESLLRDALMSHMISNNLISTYQHGFVQGRSCTTQLLAVLESWTKILDEEGGCIDSIYLDFQKAFDTVPHRRLMMKLRSYGVEGDFSNWIEDFLRDRRQLVVLGGEKSSWAPVVSGIPQGSVLGPLLFLCYINDLPEAVHAVVQMFADDAKLYRRIQKETDCVSLAADLKELEYWSSKWLLKFNISKCKVMRLGSDSPPFDYQFGSESDRQLLEVTKVEKDLGVYVDDELKYSKHIQTVANKGTRLLTMIRRAYVYLDGPSLVLLYKSLVRPHLEYGNVIWSPTLKKNIQLIENVQRRATKLVPGLKDLSYEDRLKCLGLPSLVYRRARGDMIEVYKYLHNIYNVDASFLPLDKDSITRGHSLKIKKNRCRGRDRLFFFSQRVVNPWNSLTDEIVQAPTLNTFKARLDRFWQEYMYSLEPPCMRTVKHQVKPVQTHDNKESMDQSTGTSA